MRLRLLGPLELEHTGPALGPRDRVVLSALAVRVGRPLSAERLADALWDERPPASWTKVVQGCVSRLRRVLGPDAITTMSSGYRLEAAAVEVDRDLFDDLIAQARKHAGTGSPERAASLLAEALALWRGSPFDELEEWPPGRLEVARLVELHLTAQEDLLQARLDAGEHRQVAEQGTVLVGEEPWRERRWALLALAQYRCGRQADALASIRTARRELGRELGLDPGSDLVLLERRILDQDPSLAADHEARLSALSCPWKGLASYTAEDHDFFHGRGAEVDTLLDRLDRTALLVLAGSSGSGKSSLMNAGLAPALRRLGHEYVSFTPGSDGRSAMTVALTRVGPDPILLIDQFEEVFALGDKEAAAPWLAELSAYARDRAAVVVTIRADQLAHITLDAGFARAAEFGLHLVAPLTGPALRTVIEEPARLAGLHLEPGLVDLVLRDAEGQPGALPLLSHALTQTWQRRSDRLLTVDGYQACGGIRGAVASSADRLYESLSPDERIQLRGLLLRMVAMADDDQPVRTALPHGAVTESRRKVIDLLVRSRLVTSGATSYELAHESLVRAWPKLRAWLDEDRVGQRVARHLATTAWGWESLGRPESELYRGARLLAAAEWRARPGVDLTPLELAFLDASEERAEREQRALEQQSLRQRTQNRRLRALLVGAAILLLVAVGAGAVAVDRGGAAERERDAARSAEGAAQHEALVGRSLTLRATNRSVAALLAVEAYRSRPDALARSALLGTFTASPGFLGYTYLPSQESLNAAVIPGTQRAVVSGAAGHLGVLDISTGAIRHPFGPPLPRAEDYSVIRVSADGSRVAQLLFAPRDPGRCGYYESLLQRNGRGCNTLVVHDLDTGRRVLGPTVVPFAGGDVAISDDGALVAVTGGLNGDLATYDVAGGRLLGQLPGLPRPAGVFLWRDTGAVSFGDSDHVYLGSMAGPIREVDARSLRVVRAFDAPRLSSHNNLVVTSSGLLVAAGDEAEVAIDLRTGRRRWTSDLRSELFSEPCPFFAVAEAVDRTYCGTYFGQVEERDLSTGQRTGVRLDPQLGSVGDLVVSGVGNELVGFAAAETAYSRWRLDGTGLVARLAVPGAASPIGFDPGGQYLVVEGDGRDHLDLPPVGQVVVEADTGRFVADVPRADNIAWAGPGDLAYWGRSGGGLLEVASGRTRDARPLGRSTGQVFAEPGGRHAWATSFRGDSSSVRRLGLGTGQRPGPSLEVPGFVQSVVVTPDQSRALVTYAGAEDWVTVAFDVETGKEVASGMPGQIRAAISSTGRLVAADAAGDVTEFDPRDLTPMASLPGARAGPSSLQFDDSGNHLLVTAADQTVQVYDMDTRSRLGDPIPSAAREGMVEGWLRPDGAVIAVNGPTGIVEWTIEPTAAAEAACVFAGRNLTPAEWVTYLGAGETYHRTCPDYPDG